MVNSELRNIRSVLGLTQAQFAENIGKSVIYVKKMESADLPISNNVLVKIHDLLMEKYPNFVVFAESWDEIKRVTNNEFWESLKRK